MTDNDTTRAEDREMPFTAHLAELRTRVLWALLAWILCSVAAWFIVPQMLAVMRKPLGDVQLVFLRPTEAFMVYLKTAFLGGLFLALPFILYHLAAFVSPGLEPHEKRWIRRTVPAAFLLFVGGAVFGYYCVMPVTMTFFLGFQTPDVKAMISLSEYIGFISMMLIVTGLIFQTPIVVIVLAAIGLVDAPMLRRGRRWALFLIFVIAAIVTPTPDAFTQLVVAGPMVLLYEVSIWLVVAMKRAPRQQAAPAAPVE